jgi:prepilin-type N-terminal cleavage/methylation domain-containing protein
MPMTRDDDGFSLVEAMVGMVIMAIVGAVFTTGIVQVFRTARDNEARATTQAGISQALLRLDVTNNDVTKNFLVIFPCKARR